MKLTTILISLFLIFTIGIFVLSHYSHISPNRFGYDESDYMYAASKGIWANYTDQNAISFFTFLKKGFEQGQAEGEQQSLSEFIRSSDDITFYRHYHAPLYFYWLSVWEKMFGNSEYAMRWASLALHIFGFLTIYFGMLFTLGNRARFAAMVAGIFFLFSPANIATAIKITPHAFYVLLVIINLFMMIKLFQTLELKYWYLSIAALALAFLTMEFAPLLLLTFFCSIIIFRKNLTQVWGEQKFYQVLWKSLGLFVVIFGALWAGGLFKLTILKNYLFFAYFTFVRSEAYGTQGFLDVWSQRFSNSPFEYSLLILSVVFFIFVVIKKKGYKWTSPVVIYALFMILVTVRNRSTNPYYISSLLPALFILVGITFAELIQAKKTIVQISITTVIALILLLNNRLYFAQQEKSDIYNNEIVNFFKHSGIGDQSVLIPSGYVPTLHYYFQNLNITSYDSNDISSDEILKILDHDKTNGLLYENSVENNDLEQQLSGEFDFQKDIIVNQDTSSTHIAFYKLIEKTR